MRWGILGATGYISSLLMPAIVASDKSSLVSVASRDPRGAEVVAEQYGVRAQPDYAALVADPDVDAVYVPLPNTEHLEWTLRALAAGKHVLVEKPIVLRGADLARIADAARDADRLVMEAFMYRFHPQQARAAALLADGAVGSLRLVRASFAYPIASGSGNIRLDPTLGGGATWDVGVYAVDVACVAFDREPLTVTGQSTVRPGESVETSLAGVLDFGEGRRAVLDYSIDYGPCAEYQLQGESGTITVHNAWAKDGQPGRITVTTEKETWTEELPAVDHYRLQVEAFVAAATGRGPAPVTLAESERTGRVAAALRAAAAEGHMLPLPEYTW
ncbi:Gfo/Idh/MocA family protein [Cryptosporangium aurantiacum]|uniref:Predicted dehydrogenase n=1 Tax=Cryptosporangium aurantiacum TaxID=134849 RepID=A0A1M7R8D8_9ACTN|nr:Gfo/Idh/MocA family oxidoreductase [Cryptosporangium aurantiacum]SHN42594.1 Predicted dehydrogenase [Cryptosporangium aurantiacum]